MKASYKVGMLPNSCHPHTSVRLSLCHWPKAITTAPGWVCFNHAFAYQTDPHVPATVVSLCTQGMEGSIVTRCSAGDQHRDPSKSVQNHYHQSSLVIGLYKKRKDLQRPLIAVITPSLQVITDKNTIVTIATVGREIIIVLLIWESNTVVSRGPDKTASQKLKTNIYTLLSSTGLTCSHGTKSSAEGEAPRSRWKEGMADTNEVK